MKINIIVAKGKNNEIGIDNHMPWNHLKSDMLHFKKLTLGHTVIMGRKCYESIGKPLQNRTNIVITQNEKYSTDNSVILSNSIENALKIAADNGETECFIIGGGKIYKYALNNIEIDTIYITEVNSTFNNSTVFFPKINYNIWNKTLINSVNADLNNEYDMKFYILNKKNTNI